ncbi:MAG: DNA mismatch repair protein MutS [Candidatus Kapaibacterium sp.]
MKDKLTPLMRQYNNIKEKYPETVLLFRLGDFFETFGDDAVITAKACGLTLTRRNNGAAGEMPLAGFPHHQLDAYLPKLVRSGYRVAVCEQLEDPKKAKGIVKRGVVEVVTPGVALYDKLLDAKSNNYLAAVHLEVSGTKQVAGVAFCDISTGEFKTTAVLPAKLNELIESIGPSEILLSKPQKQELLAILRPGEDFAHITALEDWIFSLEFGEEIILRHFGIKNLKGFGMEGLSAEIAASGAVLHYIGETRKGSLPHIKGLGLYNPTDYMPLDRPTRRNLEIAYSMTQPGSEGTLISILDRTSTAMGGRLLKNWLSRPLKNVDDINKRLDSVEGLFNNFEKNIALRRKLESVGDLERLISKICTGRATPRDCVALNTSLKMLPDIRSIISDIDAAALRKLAEKIIIPEEVVSLIDKALLDDPAAQAGAGGVFKTGYNSELDEYIEAKYDGKKWIKEYQERERERANIPSLKVGYNSVFGYYIEVTKVHSAKVPDDYERKQTLTNAERYISKELKEFEQKILEAEEKIALLETELFNEFREKIAAFTSSIQDLSQLIATVDCLQGFAQASKEYNYVRPLISDDFGMEIKSGRHPVVERTLPVGESFTPNDTLLKDDEMIHIITGPNMSGKSCYLRQVALIVLLGQTGCFVPAESAKFGIIDRIFTRVGAQDNISAGESTFLVEMQEAANILNNATERSLILLDEVGRGTATFDGISIAWAIAEYLHERIGAKTLFATHYHELNDLAKKYSGIKNYHVEVIETGVDIIFAHNVKPGGSDHSFGIHVARMAGMPYDVIERAGELMSLLEDSGTGGSDNGISMKKPDLTRVESRQRTEPDAGQLAIFEFRDDAIRERLDGLKIENITPVQALQILAELKREAGTKQKSKK